MPKSWCYWTTEMNIIWRNVKCWKKWIVEVKIAMLISLKKGVNFFLPFPFWNRPISSRSLMFYYFCYSFVSKYRAALAFAFSHFIFLYIYDRLIVHLPAWWRWFMNHSKKGQTSLNSKSWWGQSGKLCGTYDNEVLLSCTIL